MVRNHKYNGITVAEVGQNHLHGLFTTIPNLWLCFQVTAIRSSLETRVLQKLRSLESILQPINRLPKDIFVLIPRFLTQDGKLDPYSHFPMNRPLIKMTHVCRSWRNMLLSTTSLWTQIDFSESTRSQQAEGFIRRSGNHLLKIHQYLEEDEHVEPFLSATLRNMPRVQQLEINSCLPHLRHLLEYFSSASAPALKHLSITNDPNITDEDMKLPKVFRGRLPKLTSLTLHSLRTDLRDFNFPSLTRLIFTTGTKTSVRNIISFFERCPLLEFVQICLDYAPEPPTAPPRNRVLLAALKELRFDQSASTSGEPIQPFFPMGHGSYDTYSFPWVMGHTTSYDSIVRPMTHGG